jgi:hypothetical protein
MEIEVSGIPEKQRRNDGEISSGNPGAAGPTEENLPGDIWGELMTTTIRCADGFNHTTECPVRIVPRGGEFVQIMEFDRGVWDEVYTTPFAVEVEVVAA